VTHPHRFPRHYPHTTVPDWVLLNPSVSPKGKVLYGILLSLCVGNAKTDVVLAETVTVDEISQLFLHPVDETRQTLQELSSLEFLVKIEWQDAQETSHVVIRAHGKATPHPFVVVTVPPTAHQQWLSAARKLTQLRSGFDVVAEISRVDEKASPTPQALSLFAAAPEKPKAAKKPGRLKAAQDPHAYKKDVDFQRFWAVYPRRIAVQEAFRSWTMVVGNGVPAQVLIDAAEQYAKFADVHLLDVGHIAHPTTWLNQGRWEDELDFTPPMGGHQPYHDPNAETNGRTKDYYLDALRAAEYPTSTDNS
jgi:hypothetical protein